MKIKSWFFISLVAIGCSEQSDNITTLNYPITRKDTSIVDDYFGTKVADPYRWLEDDNSAETKAWVDTQNAVTFNYLNALPSRDSIKTRLTELTNYERFSTPIIRGGRYFYFRNNGTQNQAVLYTQDGLNGESKRLIDPNLLSKDGTVSLGSISASRDGKYLAYQLSSSGSDWNTIEILDIATGTKLNEVLEWVKFSGLEWKGNGFFYSRYDAPTEGAAFSGKNEFHKVYYHSLGTSQDKDQLIYWNATKPLRNYYAQVTDNEDAVVVYESESTSGQAMYFKKDGIKEFIPVVQGFDHDYAVIDHANGKLLCKTNNGAPNYRLVEIDTKNPSPDKWKTIIPEKEHVLEGAVVAGGKLVASYLVDVASKLDVHALDGTFIRTISLPTKGEANFSGNRNDSLAFFGFSSFTYPNTIFSYNISSGESSLFKKPDLKFNPEDFEVNQVFYPSKDGTKIPIFVIHRKGITMDGKNPCVLYGYGGFNISNTANFSPSDILFLEKGGIYASANMRGGGEYGEKWHKSGTKLQKQNVFDDFIAAAEFLISKKYTSSEKLAISGRSNGGLLVGACMTQRPDLFKVALPAVGVLDMLRFHKFTIGWAWTGDYGSSDNAEEFKALYAYSPLHNVKKTEYPATLVTTADHDDRVVPAHSFKFIATLQEHQTGTNPVLIRIDKKAGHGAGKPLSKQIEENTDIWSFVFKHLGMKF